VGGVGVGWLGVVLGPYITLGTRSVGGENTSRGPFLSTSREGKLRRQMTGKQVPDTWVFGEEGWGVTKSREQASWGREEEKYTEGRTLIAMLAIANPLRRGWSLQKTFSVDQLLHMVLYWERRTTGNRKEGGERCFRTLTWVK